MKASASSGVRIADYVADFVLRFPALDPDLAPWTIVSVIPSLVAEIASAADGEHQRSDEGVVVHRTARVESGAILKAPVVVSAGCFVAAHAYLRGGVYLDRNVTVGPGCEVKRTIVMADTVLAHMNFVGDSIIGRAVNLEAGAVVANHWNEAADPAIVVSVGGRRIATGVTKFGALIGDGARIGANAVLSPGTVLEPRAIVGRLALIDQSRSSASR